MEVVSSELKRHAPGPRGATSALDAAFLSSRVLFLSTVLRLKFNEVLVHELEGLTSIRDLLSVLTRIRTDLMAQLDPEPVLLELCESALSEVLRLLFNVSLYCTPEAPYLHHWSEILAILVHFVLDTFHATPRTTTTTTNSNDSTLHSPPSSIKSHLVAPPHHEPSTRASTIASTVMVDDHMAKPALALVPPLTSAINALLNFPLAQLDAAWRFPYEWDPMAAVVPQWRSTSPVQRDRTPTTNTVHDHAHASSAASNQEESQRNTQEEAKDHSTAARAEIGVGSHHCVRRPHPARRLAASLLARAQRHAHPLKRRTQHSLTHISPSLIRTLESEGTTTTTEAVENHTATTTSGPGSVNNDHAAPALLTALLTLLEASLMRYFGPSAPCSTTSNNPDLLRDLAPEDTSLLAVRTNTQACAQDGIKNIEENLSPLFSLLRKIIEEDDTSLGSLNCGATPLRDYVQRYLLPASLDRTIHLSLRTDFRGVLIRILSAPAYPQLMASAGALMLSVFNNDPQSLSNEIGYGPSIGFLMSAGLAGGVQKPPSHTRHASSTHRFSQGQQSGHWDPITGTLRTDTGSGGVGGTGMTEQEAAKEADVLMRLMERLNRPGVATGSAAPHAGSTSLSHELWQSQEPRSSSLSLSSSSSSSSDPSPNSKSPATNSAETQEPLESQSSSSSSKNSTVPADTQPSPSTPTLSHHRPLHPLGVDVLAGFDPTRWATPRESASTVTTISSWRSSESGENVMTVPDTGSPLPP